MYILQKCQGMKDKGRSKDVQIKKTEEKWQLNSMCDPGLGPGPKTTLFLLLHIRY